MKRYTKEEKSADIQLILLEFGGGLNSFTVAVQLKEATMAQARENKFSKLLKPDNLRIIICSFLFASNLGIHSAHIYARENQICNFHCDWFLRYPQ